MPRELVVGPDHDRNRSLGWLAAWWIERFCVHGPGDVQGQLVELDDEFLGYVADVYALGKRGRRLYDSAFLSRAKGRAKSELAGFIVLFEVFGPCRFDHWAEKGESYAWRGERFPYEPGDPVGRPITYPFVRCIATEEGQAGNTYDNVYFNLTEGPLGEGLPNDAAGLTRVLLPHGGGEIVPSTAANASKDGGKETHVVFDETHLYILAQLRAMYATVRRNMGSKRKASEPWSHETSTMYLPGEDSVAEATHKLATAILEGKTKKARLLFDHLEASGDIDLGNEKQVREGIAEAYGPFVVHMDVDRVVNEVMDLRNAEQDTRRYTFNQKTSAADAWIAQYELASRVRVDRVVADGEAIALGYDGSRRRNRGVTDATALIGTCISDGYQFEIGIWEQPAGPAGDGWEVPASEVDAAVRSAVRCWKVVAFLADPNKWETYVAAWEADFGKQLVGKASAAHPIEFWMQGGSTLKMVRALDEYHSAIVDGEMTFDGSYAFTRHLLNARRRQARNGVGIIISKREPDSPNKIDAAVAGTLSWKARLLAIAAGVGNAPESYVPRRVR